MAATMPSPCPLGVRHFRPHSCRCQDLISDAARARTPQQRKRRPVTVDGVKYWPKWAWSKGYEKHFRESHKTPSTDPLVISEKYARWLAERDGIDLGKFSAADRVYRHCVVFRVYPTDEDKFWHRNGETIVIKIPHWDFVSTVTVTLKPEPEQ